MEMKRKGYFIVGVVTSLIVILIVSGIIVARTTMNDSFNKLTVNLPSKPNDFNTIKSRVEKGILTDICFIEEGYYKQPDFYPIWEQAKISFYDNHDYTRWGIHGYGSYPADSGIKLSNMKVGEEISVCTIIKSSYGIETWQGVKIEPVENEYFKTEIITQEFSNYPNHFLLARSFPVFDKEWAKMITIKVTAKQDVLAGTYNLGFNIVSPDDRFNNEMINVLLKSESEEVKDYVNKCVNQPKIGEEKNTTYVRCQGLLSERQKMYVPGGVWNIGRNTYNLQIIAE